jgi:hypothetical protein
MHWNRGEGVGCKNFVDHPAAAQIREKKRANIPSNLIREL